MASTMVEATPDVAERPCRTGRRETSFKRGVHVPSAIEWALERAAPPVLHPRFRALPGIGLLPELVGWIDGA